MDEKIEKAISDLQSVGRHWLPDFGSSEIHEAVKARLPKHVISLVRPRPWDEHVLVDASDGPLRIEELERIAHRRKALRGQEFKGRFPV